jgi:D-glycero-alpha-D-manno-heptose-7-phosphate kinase
VVLHDRGIEKNAGSAAELLEDPATALVGSLLEALEIREPLEIEFWSDVPFGSGLGGSSALTVALMGALQRVSPRDLKGVDRVDFVRDVETRVLAKPAGVQDYYPPLEGGAHVITFRRENDRAPPASIAPGTTPHSSIPGFRTPRDEQLADPPRPPGRRRGIARSLEESAGCHRGRRGPTL